LATATTTVAQHTTLMLSWLDDANAGYFDAATTLIWLNQAQREVQKQLILAGENWYVKPVETLTVSGQADYLLPSDFLKEHRLEYIPTGYGTTSEVRSPLTCITLNQQDFIPVCLGDPANYYIKKDRFTVSPIPQTSNLYFRLYYSYKITDLTLTTDIPDIPEEFQEYVTLLAAYNGFIKDDRTPENLVLKITDYKERLKQMADDRTQDSSRRVVMTDSCDTWGYF
jgi:hypothetical protein